MRSVFYYVILFSSLLSSCLGTRFLKDGEKLLYSQSIKRVKGLNIKEIESLYANKPNKRVLFLPYSPKVGIYYRGLRKFNLENYEKKKEKVRTYYEEKIERKKGKEKVQKKYRKKLTRKIDKIDKIIKEGNFGMRNGEPLAIYDSALEINTVQKIESYLHSNGYFDAYVLFNLLSDKFSKLVNIEYNIIRNTPYIIDSLDYNIPDITVLQLYKKFLDKSFIIKKTRYTQSSLVDEREFINNLMLNNGYFDFSKQYISFDVDTTLLDGNKVVIRINIKNPNNRKNHKLFKIDSVNFTIDANITDINFPWKKIQYNSINYKYYSKRYSKKIIDWRVFLYPNTFYSKENTLETRRQLANLDIFKYTNINYDTTGGKFIANIFTSSLKKYQTSTEVGLNVSQGLPGPFFNINFKDRNVFNGLEVMEINARAGFEGLGGVSKKGNRYSSLEYGGNIIFNFPQFLFPFGKELKSRIGKLNPQTKLSFGLSLSDKPEFLRNNINASITYSWQKNQNKMFNFTLIDIRYINSELTSTFEELLLNLLRNGNNLINSFQPSFISSSIFTRNYNFNNNYNKKEKLSYLRYLIEVGGNIFNVFKSTIFKSNLQYFQYAKINIDYRTIKPINSKTSLVYRFNIGIAVPYGANKTLPYEKFFFAGGSKSIRAWIPRRLGPGSYTPLDSEGNYSDNFEQTGEILFESSVEFRHKIVGFLHGALFVDAGNVWTLRGDDARPGSQFQFNGFYNEIALGAGYGLRFDFSFLLLRFDAGLKIYDPTGMSNRKFIWDNGFNDPSYVNYQKLVWNIGIGYPF